MMSNPEGNTANSEQALASQIWGDVFEIAVKRGVLGYLQTQHLVDAEHPALHSWRDITPHHLTQQVLQQLPIAASHQAAQTQAVSYCEHLLVTGYSLGWTVIRAWLAEIEQHYADHFAYQQHSCTLVALWIPFNLPDRKLNSQESLASRWQRVAEFIRVMGVTADTDTDTWLGYGEPPQADCLLALCAPDGQHHALCLEFSLNTQPVLADFSEEPAHLDELARYVKLMQRRGVFSRITAEITAGEFRISNKMIYHIGALTTRDKPLYKLMQGCAYMSSWFKAWQLQLQKPLKAQVIAVTSAGLEGIHATLGATSPSPQAQLLDKCGATYRRMKAMKAMYSQTFSTHNEQERIRHIEGIWRILTNTLPLVLRDDLRQKLKTTAKAIMQPTHIVLRESLNAGEPNSFINPADNIPESTVLGWVGKDTEVAKFFAQATATEALAPYLQNSTSLTLRDVHTAAIQAAIESAKPNQLTVLGLEGHPGIGKTTAMAESMRRLSEELQQGWLFIYLSPRVLINDDVTGKLADTAVTLTTNFVLNSGAANWYATHHADYPITLKSPNSAVCLTTPPDQTGFQTPDINLLFLTPEQAETIRGDYSHSGFRKQVVDFQTDEITIQQRDGVMKTLGKACKAVLTRNPDLQRVVLTASIQGYRMQGQRSTVDSLFKQLFELPKAQWLYALEQDFAPRFNAIIVMVDEITGDGAGAPVVHEFAAALRKYFLKPYQQAGRTSPFRLILSIADASLSNQAMLKSYLEEQMTHSVPEKILVSPGTQAQPFSLAAQPVLLHNKATPTLHIMANSFPAQQLTLEYHMALHHVQLDRAADGKPQQPRTAIQAYSHEHNLRFSVRTILRELKSLPADEQLILFAQDKRFLRELEQILVDRDAQEQLKIPAAEIRALPKSRVAKLDSSMSLQQRRALMASPSADQPAERDTKQVWLMTSSGSRGISFPKVSRIIAFVPRFAVEGGLMEIAQLIYRGRGGGGDHRDRKLMLLLQDFILHDSTDTLATVVPPAERQRHWLQRMIDLVTMLVLVRATVFTRIMGHAALVGQDLSLVPVGKIMTDLNIHTLSETIRTAYYEAGQCKLDTDLKADVRGRAGAIEQLIEGLLGHFAWGKRERQPYSLTAPRTMHSFAQAICQPQQSLLNPIPLPDHIAGVGAILFEVWENNDMVRETLKTQYWNPSAQHDLQRLSTLLNIDYFDNKSDFPEPLRAAARDLRDLLNTYGKQLTHQQHTVKPLHANQIWIALPADYARFLLRKTPQGEWAVQPLQDAEAWLQHLRLAASVYATPAAQHPILGQYQDVPFFAMVSADNPLDFRRVFNARYFCATSEMNLLNTLLFSEG